MFDPGPGFPQFATGLPKLHRVSLLKEDESCRPIFVTHGNEKSEGRLSGGLKEFPHTSSRIVRADGEALASNVTK
jgi:hypothetical protein